MINVRSIINTGEVYCKTIAFAALVILFAIMKSIVVIVRLIPANRIGLLSLK